MSSWSDAAGATNPGAGHRRIAELEARLREAEETLEAIRAGEVDAVVVGREGESRQVYTLQTADRPYRVLIEAIQEGAITLNGEGVILYGNRAFAGILNTPLEQLIGARLSDLVPWAGQAVLTRLLTQGGRGDLALRAAGGVAVPVHLSLNALPAADESGGRVMCGVVADLTEREARSRELAEAYGRLSREVAERERTEARLHQAQKMEALGQLAGGVAHDFNNSAAVVLAGLALLEKRHGAALAATGPAVASLLAGLKEGANRGASVARRLLSFARREELRATDVEPTELLGALREVLANALGHSVRVRVNALDGLPMLHADRPQLETTLINLAVNARDAMPNGGTVVLGAAAEELPPDRARDLGLAPGGYVRIWVADTGLGMDAATLARATEPFFTSKPKDRGTGLGLAMADGFAAQSGGSLRIESAPGEGTTVTLWLPQAFRAEAIGTQAVLELKNGARHRALVVDSVSMTRHFLVDCLADAGWAAAEAIGTEQALALLADETFEVLVTDLLMPSGLDGIALIREARARQPGLPAALLSSLEAPPAVARTARREGFAILRKPVSPAEFVAFLETLARKDA